MATDPRRRPTMHRIAGHPERTSLPQRVLNLALFLAVFQAGYFLVSDTIVGQHLAFPLIDLGMLLLFGWLYGQVRLRSRLFPANHLFSVVGLLLCELNFFLNAGVAGPGLLVILSLILMLNLLHPGKAGVAYTVVGLGLAVAGIVVQTLHPDWVLGYRKPDAQALDIALTLLLCAGALTTVARMVVVFHDEVLERSGRMQAAAARSEQMASLGAMVAGLGHEIGSPAGVLAGCLSLSSQWWTEELPRLEAVWGGLHPEGRRAFFRLVGQGLAAPDLDNDTRTLRHQRVTLRAALEESGVPDAEDRAEDLVSVGLDRWETGWSALTVPGPGLEAWRLAISVLQQHRSMNLAQRAVDRIQGLVAALGAYSRTDESESRPEPTQLSVGLDSVLTLYAAAHKHKVEVVRDFDRIPPVLARPEALVQVWTNLVQNALQAMGNEGRLTVRLRAETGFALVAVEDTGPGVPVELRERIFQLFFTTKDRGSGTGIGLAIAHKVVTSHGGTIRVVDAPGGGARFEVRVPLASDD